MIIMEMQLETVFDKDQTYNQCILKKVHSQKLFELFKKCDSHAEKFHNHEIIWHMVYRIIISVYS